MSTEASKAIASLIQEREWGEYHKPNKLVPALMAECGELMDCCLWKTDDEINAMFLQNDPSIVEELADIAINLLSILEFSKLDLNDIVKNKTDEIVARYKDLPKGHHR